jgi:hypothetical protein
MYGWHGGGGSRGNVTEGNVMVSSIRINPGVDSVSDSKWGIGSGCNSKGGVGSVLDSKRGVSSVRNSKWGVGSVRDSKWGIGSVPNATRGVGSGCTTSPSLPDGLLPVVDASVSPASSRGRSV